MHSTTTGEKATAAISTVVAIAILGAAVTGQQARPPRTDRVASLESDLRYQLELAFRHDPRALKARVAAVDRTLSAWRSSPQSGSDYQLIVDWLRASIASAMPGRSGNLPPTPEFGATAPTVAARPPASGEKPRRATGAAPEEAPSPLSGIESLFEPPEPAPEAAEAIPSSADLAGEDLFGDAANPMERSISVPPATKHTAVNGRPVLRPLVTVNLAELNARIAGYHEGLTEIDAALVSRGRRAPQQLADLMDQLEQLANQHQFVSLYYDALTADEREVVAAPRSIGPTIRAMERHLAAAASNGDPLAPFDANDSAEPTLRDRLRGLSAAGGFDSDR
jgi:hypothetical protein